jgi:hypothetical protein
VCHLPPLQILIESRDESWDVGDEPTDDLWASTLGRFVAALGEVATNERTMELLVLFVARRALACWQIYCDGTGPDEGVQTAERVLAGENPKSELCRFVEPAIPMFRDVVINDCRTCDTSCAAAAVTYMAQAIVDGNPHYVILCLSAADSAFDQSPLNLHEEFRRWLIEVAVPAAVEQRPLSSEEASRFRTYSFDDLLREREHWGNLAR